MNTRRFLSIFIALLCVVTPSFAREKAEDEGKEQKERDEFFARQLLGSVANPAAAALASYFEVLKMPYWTDASGSSPKWEEIGPSVIEHGWGDMENAGRTCAFIVDPRNNGVMFAGAASGGVWKSIDYGKNWIPVADFEASLSYGALAFDATNPDIVYAGTGEPHNSIDSFHGAGMLRSMDGGKSWKLLGVDIFLGQRFSRIVSNPRRTGFIYAATSAGVFRSTDGGVHWVKVLSGAASDLLIHPRNPDWLIAGVGNAWGARENGLYRTTDAGNTWKKISEDVYQDGTQVGRIQMDHCRQLYPNVVYASLYGTSGGLKGLYKSTDFGERWIRLPKAPNYSGDSAWYNNYVAVSPTNPSVVFLGGYTTFRSIDGGETWEDNTKSYDGGPIHPDHHYFTFDPIETNTVYLCTDGGVFRSRDIGQKWESVSKGMGTVQFQYVDVHPWDKNIAYGGTQDNGTNKYTGSTAWTHVFSGDGGTTRVNWKNPEIVYTEYVNLAISKSYDGGKNWDWGVTEGIDLSEGALFYAPFNLDPSDPDTLVAGTRRVYRTTNGAKSWSPISPLLGDRVSAVSIAPNNPKVIYAGTSDGRVWATADTGGKWYEITKGLPRGYVSDVCIDPRNARVAYVCLSSWAPSRVWKTSDAGATWEDITDNLPGCPARMIALDPRNPDRLFLATENGVFVSQKGGGAWKRFGKGLPNSPVFTIVANLRTGFITVGTHGRGAWRIPLP